MFAIGVAAIGAQDLIAADFVPGLQPVPAWLPGRAALAALTGAIVVAACAAIAADRHGRIAARALTALLGLWLVALHAPVVIAHPASGAAWTPALEVAALAGAAAALGFPGAPRAGRAVYAATLPAFGALHFIYFEYVSSVIPGWIPGHAFWAVATGVAHIAGGAALLIERRARLAAILLAAMFGSWAVVLHVPRVVAQPAAAEWTSLFVAIAMAGGAWSIASQIAQRRGAP